jgi:ribosomal protein L24E
MSYAYLNNIVTQDFIFESTDDTIVATGATQATATVLRHQYNIVITVPPLSGVSLPPPDPDYPFQYGLRIMIVNQGVNSLFIYPPTSGQIDLLGTNNPYTLPVDGRIVLESANLIQWFAVASYNVSVATLANEGGGAEVYDTTNSTSTLAYLRSLFGTSNGLTVTQNTSNITIDNTLTGSNVGTGPGTLFIGKSGSTLRFNNLLGTSNGLSISAPNINNDIVIDNTLTGSNIGPGTGSVFNSKAGNLLQFNTLQGTADQVIVTQNANYVKFNTPQDIGLTSTPSFNQVTITGPVVGANDTATKGYVDAALFAFRLLDAVDVASTGPLNALYANGTADMSSGLGIGATLTNNGPQTALAIDGPLSTALGDRVLIKDQINPIHNGIYTVTVLGDAMTNWVLTRATDYNNSIAGQVGPGTFTTVTDGLTNAGTIWIETCQGSLADEIIKIGTDNICFTQFGGPGANVTTWSAGSTGFTPSIPTNGPVTLGGILNTGSGGTGLSSIGSPNQILGVNTGMSALEYKTMTAGTGGITVVPTAGAITINNTLTGSNLGTGTNLFDSKSGAALQFNSIAAGSGLGLSLASNTIIISNIGVNTIANEGGGSEVYDTTNSTSTAVILRTLFGTANGLTVTQNTSNITIDNTLTGANLGSGTALFSAKSGAALQFNSIAAGTGIGLSLAANTITISNTGVNTIANEGGGAQVYDTTASTSTAVLLRTFFGTTNGLTVTQNTSNITIDNTLTGTNLGTGTGVFSSKSGANLQFNSIAAGTGLGLSLAGNTITISNIGVNTIANEGGGAQVYDTTASTSTSILLRTLFGTTNGLTVTQNTSNITIDNTLTGANVGAGTGTIFSAKSGASLQFNTLQGTANGLTVSSPAANVITIDNTLTGSNLGTGTGLFISKTGAFLQFNSIAAGTGLGLSLAGNTITISNIGVNTIANEGGGAQVYDTTASTSTTVFLRTLFGTTNGLTVTQNTSNITIDNTLTGANLGTGTGVFSSKSGANLQFNSIAAGTGLGLSLAGNTITISNIGVNTIANEGGGAQVYDTTASTSTAILLRTLFGTTNGLTVTQNTSNITIDNTLTGTNVGTGTGTIFSAKSGANLQFNTLQGTTNGLTVSSPAANVITIDNTLTGSNLGTGTGLFISKSGAALQFNSIAAGSGLGLSLASNTITISNIGVNTIANEGGGAQVYDTTASTSTAVFLRTFFGTANGLTVTQNTSNITIDNTLTGANLGGGNGALFSAKSGQHYSLIHFKGRRMDLQYRRHPQTS